MDWLLAAALAAAVIAGAAGIDVTIAGVAIRAHDAGRVLAAAILLFAIRFRLGIESWSAWLLRMSLMTCIAFSVATWLRFLLTTIGGADSYGYVSASQMLGQGRLVEPAPIAAWLSAPGALAMASPLGWAPAANGAGIVPTYPLGLPIVMAVFSAIAPFAVFFVSPILALLTLVVVFRLARQWFDEDVAFVSTMLVAWNPVFITYAKQPMSDVPASAWLMLAIGLAFRSSPATAFAAGLAAGMAVMTRPALLIAAAVVPLLSNRRLHAAGGLAIPVAIQLALQAYLFGNPFATGYGAAESLFSVDYVATNLAIYSRHTWVALSGMWVTAVVVGIIVAPQHVKWPLMAIFSTVALPYVFYLPFDHWETLRFLLPALVPLSILGGAGLVRIASAISWQPAVAALLILLSAGLVVRNATFLRDESVWNIQDMEERYPLAGQWLDVNTPPSSVALANQHSGSLRWYGKRQTLRWDVIAPEQLEQTVRDLESHGASAYAVLEGTEVEMFDQRFAGVLDRLAIDHVGRIRNVQFRRLATSRASSPGPSSPSP
ncbi:MAG TPA: glycosyltransferase family 39 protein [Vicinamibacterales bacterium]|nr:glycosyltransferase family 39 protein [Vicinamibacterales bacterium]